MKKSIKQLKSGINKLKKSKKLKIYCDDFQKQTFSELNWILEQLTKQGYCIVYNNSLTVEQEEIINACDFDIHRKPTPIGTRLTLIAR